jgi:hypothetical protein
MVWSFLCPCFGSRRKRDRVEITLGAAAPSAAAPSTFDAAPVKSTYFNAPFPQELEYKGVVQHSGFGIGELPDERGHIRATAAVSDVRDRPVLSTI